MGRSAAGRSVANSNERYDEVEYIESEATEKMGKVLISTSLLVLLAIPGLLSWGEEYIYFFLMFFGLSGYFADEGQEILSREMLVVRNVLAVFVSFALSIFLLLGTSNVVWTGAICLSFGLIYLIGKRKYLIWAVVWALISIGLALGFDQCAEHEPSSTSLPALICIPILAAKVLDLLACAFKLAHKNSAKRGRLIN